MQICPGIEEILGEVSGGVEEDNHHSESMRIVQRPLVIAEGRVFNEILTTVVGKHKTIVVDKSPIKKLKGRGLVQYEVSLILAEVECRTFDDEVARHLEWREIHYTFMDSIMEWAKKEDRRHGLMNGC